jgi:hypothetical protein
VSTRVDTSKAHQLDPVSTRVDTSPAPVPKPKGYTGLRGGDIAPAVYEAGRLAFVERGTIVAVSEATGLSADLARRLVDVGVPTRGLASLRDAARVHAAEVERKLALHEKAASADMAKSLASTVEARAKAAKQARDHEAKVLGDAVASRADEVTLVRANRKSALALAGINADLLRTGSILARSLVEDPEGLKALKPRDRLNIVRSIAGVIHRTALASQVAVTMERLLLGQPTAILGRTDGTEPSTADMTPDEAEQWLELANKAFRRRVARRTVIDATSGTNTPTREDAIDAEVDEMVIDL